MRPNGPKYWIVQVAMVGLLAACGDAGSGSGLGDAGTDDDDDAAGDDTAGDDTPESPGNAAGAGGLGSGDCEPADPDLSEADAQGLFDYPHVPTFDFHLPEADWEALKDNAQAEEYVQAQACFEGRLVGTVGLRFKGSYGTLYECFDEQGEMLCPRLSMKVKFDEYVEDQRFYGLKRLNFNANRYDDSRIKERLAYDLYGSMGLVTPRAAWAVVRVNGESFGLYGMVEQLDGRFTADRWPENPDANLYKEAWPTTASADELASTLETNEEVADVSGFVAFSQGIAAAEEGEVLGALADFVDLEYLARYMAVDDAILSYDGITYFWTDGSISHNHNYYFYEDAPSHFTLIPWDVESTFWINPDHAAPHWTEVPEDCGLTYEYWGGFATAPGCDPVLRAMGTDLSGWRAASRELLDGPFTVESMVAAINRYAEFIGDEARAEATPTMYGSFDSAIENMRNVIPDLRAQLEARIAEE